MKNRKKTAHRTWWTRKSTQSPTGGGKVVTASPSESGHTCSSAKIKEQKNLSPPGHPHRGGEGKVGCHPTQLHPPPSGSPAAPCAPQQHAAALAGVARRAAGGGVRHAGLQRDPPLLRGAVRGERVREGLAEELPRPVQPPGVPWPQALPGAGDISSETVS